MKPQICQNQQIEKANVEAIFAIASPQTSFGVRSSRNHFSPTEGEMNAWQTNPKGRLRGGYFCKVSCEFEYSLHGRLSKRKRKGILGARETRGAPYSPAQNPLSPPFEHLPRRLVWVNRFGITSLKSWRLLPLFWTFIRAGRWNLVRVKYQNFLVYE